MNDKKNKRQNFFSWSINLAVGLCFVSISAASIRAELMQKNGTDTSSKEKIVFLDDFDPPGEDKPKDTGAGGSRDGGKCNAAQQPIHPLMPKGNFGLTSKQQPTIYLYLPQTSAQKVVLAFQDEAKTQYARAFLPIETDANIAGFTLPENKISLQVGKNYQWKISVICGEYLKPGDPTFAGWVQRVEPTDIHSDRIRYLGERGYWYDLLDAIRLSSDSSSDDWQQVLELVLDNY